MATDERETTQQQMADQHAAIAPPAVTGYDAKNPEREHARQPARDRTCTHQRAYQAQQSYEKEGRSTSIKQQSEQGVGLDASEEGIHVLLGRRLARGNDIQQQLADQRREAEEDTSCPDLRQDRSLVLDAAVQAHGRRRKGRDPAEQQIVREGPGAGRSLAQGGSSE